MSVMTYACVGMGFLALILFAIVLIFDKKISVLKNKVRFYEAENEKLCRDLDRMLEIDKIKARNRRESNEKIDSLHNGDVVGNALDVLRDDKC